MLNHYSRKHLFAALCVDLSIFAISDLIFLTNYVTFQYILKILLAFGIAILGLTMQKDGRTINWISLALMVLITSIVSMDPTISCLLILLAGMIPPLPIHHQNRMVQPNDPMETHQAYLKNLFETQKLKTFHTLH